MVLKRARKLHEIFDKRDLQFVREVHTYNGRFIHAKVLGKNVEIPYDDARVLLLRRGGSLKNEAASLPTRRYYGINENDKHFPVMRLGEVLEGIGGREKFPLPGVGELSKEASKVAETMPLFLSPPREISREREVYYNLMVEKYFTGDEGEDEEPSKKQDGSHKENRPAKRKNEEAPFLEEAFLQKKNHKSRKNQKNSKRNSGRESKRENNFHKKKMEKVYIKEMKRLYEENI